jgi:hypothetical protein
MIVSDLSILSEDRTCLRILEFADTAKLLTLNTAWVIRITLNLLLSACHAGNRQPFPGFASLGNTPMCVHSLAIDDRLAVASIIIKVAETFSWYVGSTNEPRQEMTARPDLRAKAILRHAL